MPEAPTRCAAPDYRPTVVGLSTFVVVLLMRSNVLRYRRKSRNGPPGAVRMRDFDVIRQASPVGGLVEICRRRLKAMK